ncbi:Uncharacterised protein [Mycobacterium tuberculosis]|nr:Uncharacterised protein [Mycobacterium tuberculosis]
MQITGRNNRAACEGRLLHLLRSLGRLSGVARLRLVITCLALLVRLTGLSGILTGRLRRLRRGH